MRRFTRVCVVVWSLALCLMGGLGQTRPAQAHSIYIFAWLDGDRVCSESYFVKKNKVRGGMVNVHDATGALLAEGLTDEAGLWCFPAPMPQELTLTVNGGQGHRAEFVLPAKAFTETTAQPSTDIPAKQSVPLPSDTPANVLDQNKLNTLLREAVRTELQLQLAPIKKALAERDADPGPAWRDILGGLGWIIGLAGLAAWGASRRRA